MTERAIVLVDHGSRREASNQRLAALAERIADALPGRSVHCAHLELAEPSIAQALETCVTDGAREIVVYPFFLGPGRHTQEDIPKHIDAARQRHPELRIEVKPPLGSDERIVELMIDALR